MRIYTCWPLSIRWSLFYGRGWLAETLPLEPDAGRHRGEQGDHLPLLSGWLDDWMAG